MGEESKKTVVNSWNEWDPLKHIILGRADGTMVQAPEPAVQREWLEHGFPLGTYGPYPKEMEEKANEQLDNFAKILESRGVRVDRPTPIDFSQTVQTPDWKQETMFGCMPPRDLLLTVGNEIWKRQCPTAAAGMSIFATDHCLNSTSRKIQTFALRRRPNRV